MVRTQIYLTEREQSALRALAERTGRSQSELIREAVDRLIADAMPAKRRQALDDAAGLWRNGAGRPDFTLLRSEADRIAPPRR